MMQNSDIEQQKLIYNIFKLMKVKDTKFVLKLMEDDKLTPSQKKEIIDRMEEASVKIISKAIGISQRYLLFCWDSVPGDDNEKLIRFLRGDFDIDWAENAEIRKSDDGTTINISKDENSAKIMMDEGKEKAILKIRDGRTHILKVKAENGKLNIYSQISVIEPSDIIKAAEDIGYWNPKSLKEKIENALIKGIEWLLSETHQDDGCGWGWHEGQSKSWDTSFSLLALSKAKKITLPQKIDQEEIGEKIEKGINWLIDNKNIDGNEIGWGFLPGESSKIYETCIAVYCLSELDKKDSIEVKNAVNFIKNFPRWDEGWPSDPREHSETGATSFAIKALLKSGEKRESEVIKGGINWLKENQNEDGGWGEWKGRNSIISKTCDALDALIESKYESSDKEIRDGVNWLLNKQKTVEDKGVIGWGWRKDLPDFMDLLNTALSVEILLKTGLDPMVVSPNIQWLLEQRDDDGGWGVQTPRIILSLNEYIVRA